MKKAISWEMKFSIGLLLATLLLNLLFLVIYHDLHHILLWGLTSLAFLPISVLVTTGFIDWLLSSRDKAQRMEKLNMLIGVFFSVVGTRLLRYFSSWDQTANYLRSQFGNLESLDNLGPRDGEKIFLAHSFDVSPTAADLQNLKGFFEKREDFLLRLLENPNLLEHEAFTELLRAIFHLAEELSFRQDVSALPENDVKHLAGDVKRAYGLLMRQWVAYLGHLRREYPYLYSLAVRTNPLNPEASVLVEK